MDPYARFHPLFIPPTSGSPSGPTLHAHTAHSAYLGADKWAQVLLISRYWTAKWWCSGTKMESPHIPYVWRPVGSRIMIMITSGPATSAEQ
jgi:acyl-coenzyme A synthetase/AMP-(fatty) acid ligase